MLEFDHARLRAAREAAGLSRAELGRKVGRHPQTIVLYERNVDPPTAVAARMCRLLKIRLTDLVRDDGPQPV